MKDDIRTAGPDQNREYAKVSKGNIILKTNNDVSMAFVGDMSFGDFPFCIGYGVRSEIRNNKDINIFKDVENILHKHDIVFGNLETVLSNESEMVDSLSSVEMRGDPSICNILKNAHFNCINIANNHILQHGEKPFQETINILTESGIVCVGSKSIHEWHCEPVIIEKGKKLIGILGYAFERDRYFKKESKYAFGYSDRILKDVNRLRSSVDLLIVSCHWGLEFITRPSPYTITLARNIIDAGADLVIGHHPHVLQGIEKYKHGLIAYSLGNFIFDMLWDKRLRESMVLSVCWSSRDVINYKIIPIFINDSYHPLVMSSNKAKELIDRVACLSEYINSQDIDDIEREYLKYCDEYKYISRIYRYKSYLYFLRNLSRYNKKYIYQQLRKTINSKIEDIKQQVKVYDK